MKNGHKKEMKKTSQKEIKTKDSKTIQFINQYVEVMNRKLKVKVSGNVSVLKKRYGIGASNMKKYIKPLKKYHMLGISTPNISSVLSSKLNLKLELKNAQKQPGFQKTNLFGDLKKLR